MKTIAVSILLAVSAFGQSQQKGAVTAYASHVPFAKLATMSSGLPAAGDQIQVWVKTLNTATDAFRVEVAYEAHGQTSSASASVPRNRPYSNGAEYFSGAVFPVPQGARLISFTVTELAPITKETFTPQSARASSDRQ